MQAPHKAAPQLNFVPVKFKTSRSTHKSGVSGLTSTLRAFPFTVKVMAAIGRPPGGVIPLDAVEEKWLPSNS